MLHLMLENGSIQAVFQPPVILGEFGTSSFSSLENQLQWQWENTMVKDDNLIFLRYNFLTFVGKYFHM